MLNKLGKSIAFSCVAAVAIAVIACLMMLLAASLNDFLVSSIHEYDRNVAKDQSRIKTDYPDKWAE